MSESIMIAFAGIGLLAIASQWLAWWVKLPAILFLLLAGIVAGPVTGWLDPDAMYGDLLMPVVSLSVGLILFEGALTLKFAELKGIGKVVRRLVSSGMLLTWLVIGIAAKFMLGLTWDMAMLFGALVVVTGPTVIASMLRTVRPNVAISNILRWEGIVIDPIGALLAVLVFEFIISRAAGDAILHTLITFGQVVGVGSLIGVAFGYGMGLILRHHWMPEYLHNMGTLLFVFAAFTISSVVANESGLLAVTVMGIWLANMKQVPIEDLLEFKESLSILFISGLFIVLAARIDLSELLHVGPGVVGVLLVVQFVARPLNIFFSTFGSGLTFRDKLLLSWIAPRGIVAAAISSLFAMKLADAGYAEANLLVTLTFLVILFTVVLQSFTAGYIARWLGVCDPEPKGVLFIGANLVARGLAQQLDRHGFRTLLIDHSVDYIRKARMLGLSTYLGSPVSAHASRHLDLAGIGSMMGMSQRSEMNTLAAMHYRHEFGRNRIYSLQTMKESMATERHVAADQQRGQILFGEDVNFGMLADILAKEGRFRSTRITEAFTYERYLETHRNRVIPLFVITEKKELVSMVAGRKLKPGKGSIVIALCRPVDKSPLTGDSGAGRKARSLNGAAA